jgi:RNA polymerase sigma-70 factor (ECF subfamily)
MVKPYSNQSEKDRLTEMNQVGELIPTRLSLLTRLKDWNDQESWKAFFDTYWRLIYRAAVKAGLNDSEAQEVVQETVISVSKSMPEFEYDQEKGSFKGWLLRLTSWRVSDQLRKRQRDNRFRRSEARTSTGTATIDRLPDPALGLDSSWDDDWEKNLVDAAIERVKRRVDAKHYQAFDLYVFKEWPVARVARALKMSRGRVYVIKHRISALIKKEIASLRRKPM